MKRLHWKIWVDTGGTFTDCIATSPAGIVSRFKVLSSGVLKGRILQILDAKTYRVHLHCPVKRDIFHHFNISFSNNPGIKLSIHSIDPINSIVRLEEEVSWQLKNNEVFEISSGEEVPVFAARLITETALNESFPPIELKLGSTRGTNALLERKGARVAYLTTRGFKDLLVIGTQQRTDLFALDIVKQAPLYHNVFEVNERIDSDGKILESLQNHEINRLVNEVSASACDSIAIALLNSYKNSLHEQKLQHAFLQNGFKFVSSSHALSAQIKILQRAETTVANAYLDPIIHTYVSNIQDGLHRARIRIMTSAGSLVNAQYFNPKDSLLSGPAGGVVGAATIAALSGAHHLITFDMGGTSTDVSLYNQKFSYRYESKVGDVKIFSPSLEIETIAAGGGSICDFDGYRLTVGPHSAGASPGPACYGSGGPLTITDVNLLLGRADEQFFSIPLYRKKSEEALETLLIKIKKSTGKNPKREVVLESFIQIANEKMAEAIKKVSVQQGHNPSSFGLLSFGGAGGQHACALAEMLEMKQVLIPYDAGLLSAYGIGNAQIERFEEQQVLKLLSVQEKQISKMFDALQKRGVNHLKAEGFDSKSIQRSSELLFLRFKGQESSIELEFSKGQSIRKRFEKKYKSIYGHWINDREIELESIRLVLVVQDNAKSKKQLTAKKYKPQPLKHTQIFSYGRQKKTSVYQWEQLRPGAHIIGPALVVSQNSTTVLNEQWSFELDSHNNALLRRKIKPDRTKLIQNESAALELFSNRFTAIAQEMGALLQRTSFSVNVKERLDFSCALMNAEGYLVVNAPHIPVHLGSMGVCVRSVKNKIPMQEGDVIITNHPAFGGSHLPDVTLIKPVYFNKILIGFVANRAHHAEIGGKKPGSMPADAKLLEEEGIIIHPTYLVKRGKVQWKNIKKLITSARYPTRLPDENIADLNGALAAVNLGEQSLKALCRKYSTTQVKYYMKALRTYAADLLLSKIRQSKKFSWQAEERLDDGSLLKVKIIKTKSDQLVIDFSGSSGVHPGNLNATTAIVQSVVLYVLRLWVNKPIAMNEGLMDRVSMVLPTGMLNPDFSGNHLPAVVGGNTEVSQRLTDTLLKAFGLVACSQGTMNNFLFGNNQFGFYETICGGTGAGNGFNGADATHSHMTNTRITDPEILELRYPVQLKRFEIRKGSGGSGKWHGGDGVIREIMFKEPVEVNILSQHRVIPPYGLNGGKPGKTGEQRMILKDGSIKYLKGMDSITAMAGERIIILTPGGGGYGIPDS